MNYNFRSILLNIDQLFEKGGRFEKLNPLFEAFDSFIYSTGKLTSGRVHLRDGIDLKRLMTIVVIAVMPCILFGIYNTGLQANLVIASQETSAIENWRGVIMNFFSIVPNPESCLSNFFHGFVYWLPIYIITNVVGGFWEILFAIVRKHEINEGFFVTGMLFPLLLPPSIPLWQVAVAISFGVVIGKEVFGGTGRNFLNPALVARAFLFFAYPGNISGEAVWIAADGITMATPLAELMEGVSTTGFLDAFWGLIPGSIGETSTVACLIGAIILIITGIGSWRIILSVVVSAVFFSFCLNLIGSETNLMFGVSPWMHLVLGGFAFGTVFMATDPVTASTTITGHYIYGGLIGFMAIFIRVINPAFPEGMMLAILFANMCAPIIDYFIIERNIKKREAGYGR